MKWLKSTSNNSYTAQGRVIPPSGSAPVQVTEAEFEKIASMAVIKSLIASGGIIVLDKYTGAPTGDAATVKLQNLTSENTKLATKVRELEEQLANASAPVKEEEAPTKKEVKAAQKAQADAEAKLAELQAKYEALEKEASEKIAQLSAEKDAE